MAVPWINFLAPSMGGIGPIELADLGKLQKLQEKNNVPFYAGRFYPKNSKAIIEGFSIGLISETPPWLTWETIEDTQIWMVPALEDERVVSMQTSIERIDLWSRDDDDPAEIPDFNEDTIRHMNAVNNGWGLVNPGPATNVANNSIDPAVIVTPNVIPPAIVLGYVGITSISGRVSEYGFYDAELHIVNGKEYGQQHLITDEYEMIRIREDGAWIRRNAELPINEEGQLATVFTDDDDAGLPRERGVGLWRLNEYPANGDYPSWVIDSDINEARTVGGYYWDFFTRWLGDNEPNPKAGLISMRPSRLDTLVYTIKVSCITINVPDPVPGSTALTLADYARSGLETFGSNLTNNLWYFYWPIRYNGDIASERYEYLLARAGINRIDNPDYLPPASNT